MHFIDLHYKGVLIRRGWRHMLRSCFTTLYFIPFIFYIGRTVISDWQWSLTSLPDVTGEDIVHMFIRSAILSAVILVLLLFILHPLWDYLADLQRVCRMIYSAQFYLVNDIETPNMFQNKKAKVKKEIAYFPHFYFKAKRGIREVTVRLDGSKFHLKGSYQELTPTLEEMLGLAVVEIKEREGYITYCLLKDAQRFRISIDGVKPDKYTIPLMQHISWNIAKTPHALINGATGGGKTFFLNALIKAFVQMGADLRICDPKNSSLADYVSIMSNVAVDKQDIIDSVEKAVEDMENRYVEIKKHKDYISGQDFTNYNLPPIVLIIDEYVAFMSTFSKKERDAFESAMSQIVMKGREAGVFVILATQRPDAKSLSGDVRDQLGLRVSLGKMSKEGYRMTFGATEQRLRNKGKGGRGYVYVDGMSFVQEFYAPLVPPKYRFIEEVAKILS